VPRYCKFFVLCSGQTGFLPSERGRSDSKDQPGSLVRTIFFRFIKGRVYVSEFDDQMAGKIAKIQNNLFTWLQDGPVPLPEDLCVFKRGAKLPVLLSHSVDREAFVISEACPPGFNASNLNLEDLNIWSGKYFCRI
jgi:hypothetical protein